MNTTAVKTDIAKQIFEEFMEELTIAGLPLELIVRLRKSLLEDSSFSDRALRAAIFEEGQSE